MTGLASLQARFQAYLLAGEQDFEGLIVGSEELPARTRLAVYTEAYRLRLLEVLAVDFSGLKGLLGDAAFEALAGAYTKAHPSDHPSIRWFGRHLAGFLRGAEPYRSQPVLAEMADFEWAQGEVTDAADSPVMRVAELGALAAEDWPGMRIDLQSAARRLDLEWNIPKLWQCVHDGDAAFPVPERAASPVPWLLWRRGLEVHWRSLSDDERYAIDAARNGDTFGTICEGLLARCHDDQVPARAAGFLKGWTTDELVARIAS